MSSSLPPARAYKPLGPRVKKTGTRRPSHTSIKNVKTKRQSIYATVNSSTESLCNYNSCLPNSNSSANRKVKTAMKAPVEFMDCDDFDSLPPAIRRKYFSSLERLRYAQQSTASPSNHPRAYGTGVKYPSPPNTRDRQSSDSFRTQSSIKNRKHRNNADAFVFSQGDAQWFLELPETIRRKHFSREERILLANKCESIIVDAADEALYRLGRRTERSYSNDESLLALTEISSAASSRRLSIDSDIRTAREEVRRSFQWMDEPCELDLRLRQFCQQEQSFYIPPTRHSSPPGLRYDTPSSSQPRLDTPGSTTSRRQPSFTYNRPTTCISQPSVSSLTQRVSFFGDSDAAYYRDPEARLKLRVYLASPQKFDEAIEFGFPSQAEMHNFFTPCQKVTPAARDMESSELDLGDSDLDTSPVLDQIEAIFPSLFSVPQDPVARISSSSAAGSTSTKATRLNPYPHTSPGNREMTLRMTLTRKDLRADESALNGPTKDEALTLEDLPPEREHNGAAIDWDAIEKESSSSGLKKLWRKVKGLS